VRRPELEHIIRAGGAITGCRTLIILGSQAILGAFPDAPPELLRSVEADCYPQDDPSLADLIDGSIGELSPFHETFGYYAHGVGPETAALPAKWEERLVRIESEQTGGTAGLCLSPADLAVSKLISGREKDLDYVRTMVRTGLVSPEMLASLRAELTTDRAMLLTRRLASCFPGPPV
jgi:hypothetical protein